MNDDSVLRVVLLLVALFVLMPLIGMAVFWPLMGGAHGGMWNGGVVWWPLSWLVLLAIIGGVGYLIVSAFRDGGSTDPAMEELRRAYARGDLTDEEFERRHDRLRREE